MYTVITLLGSAPSILHLPGAPENVELVDIYDLSGAVETETDNNYGDNEQTTFDYPISTIINSLSTDYDSEEFTTAYTTTQVLTNTPRFREFTTVPDDQDMELTLWGNLNKWTQSLGSTTSFLMGATISIMLISVVYGVVRAVQAVLAKKEMHIHVHNQAPPATPCNTRHKKERQVTFPTPTNMEQGATALMRAQSNDSFTSEAGTEMTDFPVYEQVASATPPPPAYPTPPSPNTGYVSIQSLIKRMKK